MAQNPPQQLFEAFKDSRQLGMAGLNTMLPAVDIGDNFSPDMSNMVFDNGVLTPRPGSVLYASKPTGETAAPLQCIVPRDSAGNEYLISVYGTNFYLYDSINKYQIKINHTYTPTITGTIYGNAPWNAGLGADRQYLCNGTDNVAKWQMSLNHLSGNILTGATTLPLTDSTSFGTPFTDTISSVGSNEIVMSTGPTKYTKTGQPIFYTGTGTPIGGLSFNTLYYAISDSTGDVKKMSLATSLANAKAGTAITLSGSANGSIYFASPISVYDGTTYKTVFFYINSANTLTLTSTIGAAYGIGTSVVSEIQEVPSVYRGRIFGKNSGRLWISNQTGGGESNVAWSASGDPEDFVPDNFTDSANRTGIFDGTGATSDMGDFGEFMLVSKEDFLSEIAFTIDQTNATYITKVSPLISGRGMGPIIGGSAVKVMNTLYYPTRNNGIISLSPVTTGANSSTGLQMLSKNIHNYVTQNVDFSNKSRGCHWRNKIFWTCAISGAQVNSSVLMYDVIRDSFTKIDSWSATDIFTMGTSLYRLSAVDGNIYQCWSGYTDNNQPYYSYFYTKAWNWGFMALPKTLDALYVEGFFSYSTNLYIDVMYNDGGKLQIKTYLLNKDTPRIQYNPVKISAMEQSAMEIIPNGVIAASQIGQVGTFRCYLSLPNNFGIFNMQAKIYSRDEDSFWGIAGISPNPEVEKVISPTLRVDAIGDSSVTHSFGFFNSQTLPTTIRKIINITGTINGTNKIFTLAQAPTTQSYYVVINNSIYTSDDSVYGFIVSGTTITFTNPIAADLLGSIIKMICV